MRILVVGGAGYIGSHAAKALHRAGYRVVVYDNLVAGHRAAVKYGTLVTGDITDLDAVRHALRAHEEEQDFRELVRADDEIAGRVELEELEDLPQDADRVTDELLVLEDVHTGEMLAVSLEERMAVEPVLEHPVEAPSAAPLRRRDRDRNRMAHYDDERGARIERLEEARLEQVGR